MYRVCWVRPRARHSSNFETCVWTAKVVQNPIHFIFYFRAAAYQLRNLMDQVQEASCRQSKMDSEMSPVGLSVEDSQRTAPSYAITLAFMLSSGPKNNIPRDWEVITVPDNSYYSLEK